MRNLQIYITAGQELILLMFSFAFVYKYFVVVAHAKQISFQEGLININLTFIE